MSHGSGFLGVRIPFEVELMVKQLKDLDREIFRKILKIVANSLEGKDSKESVKSLAKTESLSEQQLSHILAGMYTLLQEALRLPPSSLKQEVFKDDLRDIRIPEELISDFAGVVFGDRRSILDAAALQQGNRLPGVQDFRWRVDVAISSSSLTRALQPSILVQLKLSDGNAHRFECYF
ncbi:COMM domain-containing protein 5 isoform X3 [Narcine bancroftii]|uniref:COMM domain-containing protein 5 isoform X3 n=1 Tax=Narcine bancroftii TaxID=1343680 RepID=UPI003831F217